MQLLNTVWSTQEALDEYFKETWVRVNPNSPMPFISDTKNEEKEEGESDIGMFEVQVFGVFTLQKLLMTR